VVAVSSKNSGLWNGGTFDRLAWTNAGGADNNGGTSTAADTAITHYVRTAGTNNRSLSVDAQNDLWVGGFSNKTYQELDGNTGAVKTAAFNLSTPSGTGGGYGSLIDGDGVLWAAGWDQPWVSRYDTNTNTDLGDVAVGGPSYGLGIDSEGNVWNSHFSSNTISKISNDGTTVMTFASGGVASRGVAVTADDNVWVANSGSATVSRLANDGTLLGTIAVGVTPTGVAVDRNGKVWVTNFNSDSVMRIDPTLGVGAVDLTIELGPGATPYNYSDMTGTVSVGTTNPQGFWTYTADGGSTDTFWDRIFWNEEGEGAEPVGTGIVDRGRGARG
jgi:streptogramin lyase